MTGEMLRRILVVDDEPAFRVLLHTVLTACGYAVSEVLVWGAARDLPDQFAVRHHHPGVQNQDSKNCIFGPRERNSLFIDGNQPPPQIHLQIAFAEDRLVLVRSPAPEYRTDTRLTCCM